MKASIFIVEDEDSLGILLTYNLESAGFDAQLCTHGDEVEMFIDEKTSDLILLNWMLHGASGIEICSRLKQKNPPAIYP